MKKVFSTEEDICVVELLAATLHRYSSYGQTPDALLPCSQ